jgi:tetratricopeptide (TPR) repeat protein
LFDDGRIGEATAAFRRARGLQDNRANCDGLGGCLLELRQLDDAAACFRAALEHDPTNAVAHAHRGLVERLQGRFADAIASFERSRELASTAWAANCRGWIAETERLAAAERALPDPLAPGATTVRASVESAVAAYVTGRPLLAAAMFAAVFESDPPAAAGAFLGWNRDWAVRAALAAAAARSRDAEGLDDAGRAQWRALAADWLGRAIADCRASYDRGMAAPADVRRRIEQWRAMPGLEALVAQSPGNGREAAGKSGSLRDGLAELDARLRDGEPAAVVDAAFADICTLHRLGPVPGVLMPYGGMVFDRTDADVLILGGHAQRATGSLYSVALSRDGDGRVCGFRARARRFAKASFVDGGLVFGPDDLLLFTRWPTSEIGQLRRDSREPDRVQTLPVPSAGGLGIVPAGFPGAGRVKVLAWPGGEWFDARLDLLEDSVSIQAPAQSAALAGGPDGFAWLQPRPPHFARPAILVAEWSRHALATYDLDDRGDPIVATRRLVVSGIRGALGLAVDPRTGDILISTWRNDGTDEIAVLAFHR